MMSSISEQKKSAELRHSQAQALRELDKAVTRSNHWDWIASIGGLVLGVLFSLFASAASISGSFTSLLDSIRIRRTYVWFLSGVIGFQLVLVLLLWLIRRKNRDVIRLKEHLIGVYLSALNRSRLNPKPETNG